MIKRILAAAVVIIMLFCFTSCGNEEEIVEHSISIAQELVNSGNPSAAKIAISETLKKYPDNQRLVDYLTELESSVAQVPVPSDAEALQKFYDAYSLYVKWYVSGVDRVSHEKVKAKEVDNTEYYVVTENGYASASDIHNEFLRYYSSEFIADITAASPISYEDADGKLYLKYRKDDGIRIKTIDELSIKETKINDDNFELTYQLLYDGGETGIAGGSTHLVRTQDGYVLDSESVTELTCPVEAGQYTVNIESELAELRDLPHNNAEIIASLEDETEVTVCSGNDTWAYVKSEDFSGWICISYLRKGAPEDEEIDSAGDLIGGIVDYGIDFFHRFW